MAHIYQNIIMDSGRLATQGAKASEAMILIKFCRNIPLAAP